MFLIPLFPIFLWMNVLSPCLEEVILIPGDSGCQKCISWTTENMPGISTPTTDPSIPGDETRALETYPVGSFPAYQLDCTF